LAAVAAIQPLVFLNLPLGKISLAFSGWLGTRSSESPAPLHDFLRLPRAMFTARRASWVLLAHVRLGLELEAVFVKRHQRARSLATFCRKPS
jgi:hypothetical protein